jgi:nucleotidyltransferase/DNA polymerase involved in DNA repair
MLVCLLAADFAAQAERLAARTHAPLLLTTGTRQVVAACDSQARKQGVQRGMPLKRAKALCPDAEIRPLAHLRQRAPFEALLEVASEFASRFEVQPPLNGSDPILWLDLGTSADVHSLARQIRAVVHDRDKLSVGVGAGQGKFPTLAAASEGAVTVIASGREAAYLAPHPVDLLPLLPDERRRLGLFGLHRLGQLAALPRSASLAQFGRRGRLLHQLASGDDPRPLNPWQPPHVERLARCFPEPLADREQLDRCLRDLAAEAAARLHQHGAACGCITLGLTTEAGEAHEAVRTLREPRNAEPVLLRLLQGLCNELPLAGIGAIDVELSALTAEQPQQLRLFDAPAKKQRSAREVARALMLRHDPSAFVTAVLPEDAEMMPELISFLPLEEGL